MTEHVRHIPLEGNFNLRDIGGYQSALGGTVRRGCLYRSDELHALTDADLDVIAGLGVRVVFDLRNDLERTLRPSKLWNDVDLHERESVATEGPGDSIEDLIRQGDLFEPDDQTFGDIYIGLINHLAPELRRVLELAINAHERPLLFHCAAGKDRTGITAALLLGLLGVDEETILEDYELTNEYFAPRRYAELEPLVIEHGANAEHVRIICSARRAVLKRTLDHIHDTCSDFDTYAIEALGVDKEIPERLRQTLLI